MFTAFPTPGLVLARAVSVMVIVIAGISRMKTLPDASLTVARVVPLKVTRSGTALNVEESGRAVVSSSAWSAALSFPGVLTGAAAVVVGLPSPVNIQSILSPFSLWSFSRISASGILPVFM